MSESIVLGYVVVLTDDEGRRAIDWDGELHLDRETAETERIAAQARGYGRAVVGVVSGDVS
jgi:hypothetical protein